MCNEIELSEYLLYRKYLRTLIHITTTKKVFPIISRGVLVQNVLTGYYTVEVNINR